MKTQAKYFKYVMMHRWYAFIGCVKMGLWWQGIIHDLSKLSKAEWMPYLHWFHTPQGIKFKGESFTHTRYKEEFDKAWLHHLHTNPHHWQFWIMPDSQVILAMPEKYVKEMVADWSAAGRAQGHGDDLMAWYERNKDMMKLHPETIQLVEALVYAPR
jgi:hypothetical protein